MLFDIKQMDDGHQEQIQAIKEEDEEQDVGGDVKLHPYGTNNLNPMEMNQQFTEESRDMEFDQEQEEEMQQFQERKQTIIENMTKLIDAKYPEDKEKHKDMINQVKESLDEEEQIFRLTSVKIMNHRITIKRKQVD